VSHTNPHPPALHVARAFAGVGHAPAHEPQCAGSLVTSTQVLPQRVLVAPEQPVAHAYEVPDAVHIGADASHATVHPPHVEGSEMSVSQPSSGDPLQSA
jgi:hypothetical protein